MSTDDGAPAAPHCAHCGATLEPGHITCPQCGHARALGALGGPDAAVVPSPGPAVAPAAEVAGADPGAGSPPDDADPFDLSDPYRDVVRHRPLGPAPRSRTTLLIGGLLGMILVVLVAAAALWALDQHQRVGF